MSTPSSSAFVDDDAQHLAVAQPALDRASFGGQIARAIAADPGARAEVLAQRLAKRREHDLDRGPRPPEDHRLATRAKEGQRPPLGQGHRRTARPGGGVQDRRIDQQHVSLARRRAVAVDQAHRPSDERLGQLLRVPDRRRAAHDDGVRAVVAAQPQQPPQDVRDVAPEHAAVRVELVDDDDPQLLEQLEPLGVVGQDRRVEHVRVGHDDLPGLADRRSDGRRGVAVVGRAWRCPGRPPRRAGRTPRPGPGPAPWWGRVRVTGRPDPRRSTGGWAARSTATCPTPWA